MPGIMADSFGAWLGAGLVGYCFGCVNMAWLLGFWKGVDIKQSGTGNAGASNALISMGIGYGVATALWDILKPVLAALFVAYVFSGGHDMRMLGAGMAVVGHCFPFWLDFRGGKGFAPFLGFMLVCSWQGAIAVALAGLVLAFLTDRIVAMTFVCAIAWPFVLGAVLGVPYGAICGVLSMAILLPHRRNVMNLISGTEPGIRAALRKK